MGYHFGNTYLFDATVDLLNPENNPTGTFADWNPKVSCRHAVSSEIF
jgi:hypothetical protein